MLNIIKRYKLYEESDGGGSSGVSGSSVLKLSKDGLNTASEKYNDIAKKILQELVGTDDFDSANVENATGGIAGQIKKLKDDGYWTDQQGESFTIKANEALSAIKTAAVNIKTNAVFLSNVSSYVGEVTGEVQGKINGLIGSSE